MQRLPDRSGDLQGRDQTPRWADRMLQRFGKNCWGEPMYRLVWAPSRFQVVGGYWNHLDRCAYIPCQLYGDEPRWVLEKHQMPTLTADEWDTRYQAEEGYLSIGPYPVYGEYFECFRFSAGAGVAGYVPIESGLLETATRLVDMGKHVTYTENRLAARERMKKKDSEWEAMVDAEWDESQRIRQGLAIGAGGRIEGAEKEYEEYERAWRKRQGLTNAPGSQQL